MANGNRHTNAQAGSGAESNGEERLGKAVVSITTRALTVVHVPDRTRGLWEMEDRGVLLWVEMGDGLFQAGLDSGRIRVRPGDEVVCRLWTSHRPSPEHGHVRHRISEVAEYRPQSPPAPVAVGIDRPWLWRMDALMDTFTRR